MIREAMQYIATLKAESMEPIVTEINGKTYCNKDLRRYDSPSMAEPISARTLTALVDYMRHRGEEMKGYMIIHVRDPKKVELYSGLNEERNREHLFTANAMTPDFSYGNWYPQEDFIISMQANFEMSEDLEKILLVAGNVEAKTTANYTDDGVSQKATIKQGIASKADILVPNPVTLIPYRTFLEVEQPASKFVFRIKDSGGEPYFKIVEAEGGLWKNEAMQSIKTYLEDQLQGVTTGRLTIIA